MQRESRQDECVMRRKAYKNYCIRLRLGELFRTDHTLWLPHFVLETQRSTFCRGSVGKRKLFGNLNCDNIYKNEQ